ncbi:hypothetical protein T01_6783 [Trichinella spiralis]|uniref:Uncharacterized protein n=1 Tax=Trichinella spiralis TaxID=6334 RepID=A0A0V1BE78_TRISP|nr:hypothetical protein T01_6783 [Trichinella spiralis]
MKSLRDEQPNINAKVRMNGRTKFSYIFAKTTKSKEDESLQISRTGLKMKENRLAQNNEILHKTWQFQRIPHYNVEKHFYTKIQPPSIRFNGFSDGLLPCVLR